MLDSQRTSGDHIFGLAPLLAARLNGAGGFAEGAEDPRSQIEHLETNQSVRTYFRFSNTKP